MLEKPENVCFLAQVQKYKKKTNCYITFMIAFSFGDFKLIFLIFV